MTNDHFAFVVGAINTQTGAFSASIFGESAPTLGTRFFCFTIARASGIDYEEARHNLAAQIENNPGISWIKPVLNGYSADRALSATSVVETT